MGPIDGAVGGELDQPIAKCVFCGTVAEMCFNCNSMRCNSVFVACPSCAHTHKGCCSEECSKHTTRHFIPRNRRQKAEGKRGHGGEGGALQNLGEGDGSRKLVTIFLTQ